MSGAAIKPAAAEFGDGGFTLTRVFDAPQRLVFTNNAVDGDGKMLLEGLTAITFAEQDGKTTMTLKTCAVGRVPIARQMLAGMEAGWAQSIDKLEELVVR